MASLYDKLNATEQNEAPRKTNKMTTVQKITKSNIKDKVVSAKFNSDMYRRFTEINKAQGITNNSALNMILAKYVKENADFLDEE